MSVNINRVIIAGNLTRDPQARFLANEKCVCNFGLAVNRKWRGSDGEMKEETTFVDVSAFGRTGELVEKYLSKGSSCLIEGRLKLDQWEDKDGNRRSKLQVIADSVQFLGSRNSSEPKSNEPSDHERDKSNGYAPADKAADLDEEPPFRSAA